MGRRARLVRVVPDLAGVIWGKGAIMELIGKAKSVILTVDGGQKAKQLFEEMFVRK
jgi:hypothetical protein